MKRLVMVEWLDAITNPNWRPLADVKADKAPLARNIEYGFIVRQDDKVVVIAHGYCTDTGDVSSTTAIPRSWIKRIKRV